MNISIRNCLYGKMKKKLRINSEIKNLRIVEKAIDEISIKIGIKQDYYGKILVSTLEAVNNAIIHGNKSEVEKIVDVEIAYSRSILRITISDEGPGFKPKEVPDPTSAENIENLRGRGVFLMSKLADIIEFNEKGNQVTMTFKDIRT
jgi:serine/threonine-protein kinase RsbW